jgi:SAM-dependent methyltransferase
MNAFHRWLCGSSLWKSAVERHMLPWVLADVPLGPHVLEVGPGPGVTTELLRPRTEHLTCVEIDCGLAQRLARRMSGRAVSIVCADATALPLPDGAFDTALSLTMLHHVPSAALQDRLLAEIARVLRPGGIFAGADSLASPLFRLLHLGDEMLPIDPGGFAARLSAAGFVDPQVDVRSHDFRFRAMRTRAAA